MVAIANRSSRLNVWVEINEEPARVLIDLEANKVYIILVYMILVYIILVYIILVYIILVYIILVYMKR